MDVLLACMPFGPVFSPSLGLSLLKAGLRRDGIDASVRYFSIRFAELIGQHFYCGVAGEGRPPLTDMPGEWIFAGALDAARAPHEPYVDRILRGSASEATIRRMLSARGQVEPFLAECRDEVAAARPRIVGFTSTFQQHVASLALARRIKDALPDTFIVFGGANCEGIMGAETVRRFAFVDAVVSGEGDVAFPELVRRMLSGASIDDLTGVHTKRSIGRGLGLGTFANTPVVRSLDELPFPDFSDYMTQFAASPFDKGWNPTLLLETSRGCWWGAKHHCTFCGLNGTTMAFRSKSAARALEELRSTTARYPDCSVDVVDNILDMQYFKTFLPELAKSGPRVDLFYETKANLRKDQVRLLRDAGVTEIQPGIESFSDSVLKLMDKGVSALQNVQLLKWCKEFGVRPIWNVLWGFPDEPPEEYARMASIVPLLTHLPPPYASSAIRLDRFSPNFVNAEQRGLRDVRPFDSYGYLYALPSDAVRNLAYFFEFGYSDGRDPSTYVRPLARALRRWRRSHRNSDLFSIEADGLLLVCDFRTDATQAIVTLSGIDRLLYRACDQIADLAALTAAARSHGDEGDVRGRLDRLVAAGLLLEDHGRYLALAIEVGTYQPAPHIASRLFGEIRRFGRTLGGVPIRAEGPIPRTRLSAARFSAAADGTVIVRRAGGGPA